VGKDRSGDSRTLLVIFREDGVGSLDQGEGSGGQGGTLYPPRIQPSVSAPPFQDDSGTMAVWRQNIPPKSTALDSQNLNS